VHFDSIKSGRWREVGGVLQEFLLEHGILKQETARQLVAQVPLQDNSCDCGLYMLHFIESILMSFVLASGRWGLERCVQLQFDRAEVSLKREKISHMLQNIFAAEKRPFDEGIASPFQALLPNFSSTLAR
jgi:Ulp1 family protease